MTTQIEEKLDMLSEFQSEKDASQLAKQDAIDSIYTPEIKAQLRDIETEFAGRDETVDEMIMVLTAEIKKDVLDHGATVKGEYNMAVFNKGRVSWDNKALKGYAADKPELLQFKKTGNPSISIRTR